jgi:hypothetical protein
MRISRGWTGLRTAVVALAFTALSATGASASPSLVNYSTSGTVNATGISGSNVISFNSVSNGAFVTPSAFSLGEFLVAALPAGVSTTYSNTPFSVTFGIQQVDGVNVSFLPVAITGHLNGTISGPSQSSVVATFDPVATPNLNVGGSSDVLSILSPTVSLVPSTTNGGRTTVQNQLLSNSIPLPEPATLAVFLTALAGLGLHRRLRRTR